MEKVLRDLLERGKIERCTAARSKAMAAVRGRDNRTTERRLKMALVSAGVRGWSCHTKEIKGRPDFYFASASVAVFADGCFWHGCPVCGHIPKKNQEFWGLKLRRNVERDNATTSALASEGVLVLRFWEHEIKGELQQCVARVQEAIRGRAG